MKRRIILIGVLSVYLLACSRSTAEPTFTPTLSPTIGPTSTPTVTPTSTPVELTLLVKAELINCRSGPGTEYVPVNELSAGESARVVGRNDSSTWWYIRDSGNPGGFCWVSADVTEIQGLANELPVNGPSFVTVTNVNLRVEPNRILVKCDQFPQTVFFEAEITTDGPTLLTWKWEASTGVTSGEGNLVFEEAGTQLINEFYQISAPNEYWVKLHILTPNQLTEQVNFPVSCTP